MRPNTKRKVTFTLKDAPGKKIFVAGSFNKWNPNASPLSDCDQKAYIRRLYGFLAGATSTNLSLTISGRSIRPTRNLSSMGMDR